MQRPLIAPLTGIRALAAFWVVLRHFRGEIVDAFPWSAPLVPFMSVGYLGVDLFFLLSGFILAVSYVDRFGAHGWDWRRALGFVWLRIARVWPVAAVALLLYGLGNAALGLITGDRALLEQLNPARLLLHLTLTDAWVPGPLDWLGVDWSISSELLAYLTFTVGVILLVRLLAQGNRTALAIAALCLTLPMVIVGLSSQDGSILVFQHNSYQIDPGLLALRVLTEFWAGALFATAILPRLDSGRPSPWSRAWFPTIIAVLSIAIVVFVATHDPYRWKRPQETSTHAGVAWIATSESVVVIPLFLLLIGTLALCARDPLSRLLSTRAFVFGGRVSYALYLSHPLAIGAAVLALKRFGTHGAYASAIVIGLLIAVWVFAWVLYRFVEEPARRYLRRLLPARALP